MHRRCHMLQCSICSYKILLFLLHRTLYGYALDAPNPKCKADFSLKLCHINKPARSMTIISHDSGLDTFSLPHSWICWICVSKSPGFPSGNGAPYFRNCIIVYINIWTVNPFSRGHHAFLFVYLCQAHNAFCNVGHSFGGFNTLATLTVSIGSFK